MNDEKLNMETCKNLTFTSEEAGCFLEVVEVTWYYNNIDMDLHKLSLYTKMSEFKAGLSLIYTTYPIALHRLVKFSASKRRCYSDSCSTSIKLKSFCILGARGIFEKITMICFSLVLQAPA